MDANDVKKKFFDITPPSSAASNSKAPKIVPQKRQVMVSEPDSQPADVLLPPSEVGTSSEKTVKPPTTQKAKTILPPAPEETAAKKADDTKEDSVKEAESIVPSPSVETEVAEASEGQTTELPPSELTDSTPASSDEMPAVDPLPTSTAQEPEEAPVSEPEPEDKETPVTDTFSAKDSLPDDSQKAADAIKTEMQEPKIYDTTAYHVPIKETMHGHGVTSAFVFGAIFAVITVAGIILAVIKFGA